MTVAGAGIAALVLGGSPAYAYSGPAYQGSDYARTIGINDDIIEVCDQEADGHGVYTEYYLNDGSYHKRGDGNGSASPCYVDDWTQTPYWVNHYRVCETGVACSGWVYTDGIGGH
jgi:hypothetical protein